MKDGQNLQNGWLWITEVYWQCCLSIDCA